MTAYYNEINPVAAAVLRELSATGIIAPGHVDNRSIKDVTADDLKGFTQCHFFAGAGLWSVAARIAGWPDYRPLWSASCPCQPFSAAGRRAGADDPRHLWPDLFRLIRDARARGFGPPVIVGEQVSGQAGYGWFDGVGTDLATENYASRARDIPACAVDSPQQRNRLWWFALADADGIRGRARHGGAGLREAGTEHDWYKPANGTDAGTMVDAAVERRGEGRAEAAILGRRSAAAGADVRERRASDVAGGEGKRRRRDEPQRGPQGRTADGRVDEGDRQGAMGGPERAGLQGHAGDGDRGRVSGRRPDRIRGAREATSAGRSVAEADGRRPGDLADCHALVVQGQPSAWPGQNHDADVGTRRRNDLNTFWSGWEWIVCHDGKARRAQPGIRMLVDGMVGRIDLWSLAGNSIVPQLAAEVIAAIPPEVTALLDSGRRA